MREQFEKLPEIAKILKYNEKSYFDEATGEYVSQYSYLSGYLNGAWYAWQAKAQAVPEGFVLVPIKPSAMQASVVAIGFSL